MKKHKTVRAKTAPAKSVFVVDDNALLVEFAATVLEKAGYVVKPFVKPKEVLAAMRKAKPKPAVLVTDYEMAEMNGLELIESSHKIHPALKTLLLSGTVDRSITLTHAAKVHRFLGKPYEPAQLKKAVAELLAEVTAGEGRPPFSLSAQTSMPSDLDFMRLALRLARRGFGRTSPNPMVGAILARDGDIIGQGWHHRAGESHAEIEALRDAQRRDLGGRGARGATLYVTLEPCSTHGRTPPCTDAIIAGGVQRVVVAASDPNPAHAGRGFAILREAGLEVSAGLLAMEATAMNEAFEHWIVRRTPLVTIKAAMSLDGKIATLAGESRWLTGQKARRVGMKLRAGADAILVGVKTVLADDPSLTVRLPGFTEKRWRRIILDPRARTPVTAKVVTDEQAASTILVVTKAAPARRADALARRVRLLRAPVKADGIDLPWLLKQLGREEITSLLVEGGGETNGAFLSAGLVVRAVFFYAPLVLGGRGAPKAVAGQGVGSLGEALVLNMARWRRIGADVFLSARVSENRARK